MLECSLRCVQNLQTLLTDAICKITFSIDKAHPISQTFPLGILQNSTILSDLYFYMVRWRFFTYSDWFHSQEVSFYKISNEVSNLNFCAKNKPLHISNCQQFSVIFSNSISNSQQFSTILSDAQQYSILHCVLLNVAEYRW